MATMTLLIYVKIYWEELNVLSYTPEIQFNVPNTNPGWLRDCTAYAIVKTRRKGLITITSEAPDDGYRGDEHLDESGRVRGFTNNFDCVEYEGDQDIHANPQTHNSNLLP